MTKNIKGLMQVLQQSINEAILDSHDVAAAMAALKRTGKCPVFTIDISMQDPPAAAGEEPEEEYDVQDVPVLLADASRTPAVAARNSEELVLSDWDVQFLATLGVRDPSWSHDASSNLDRP